MDPSPSIPASLRSSRAASVIRNKEHSAILEGDLSLKYEHRSRTVRVYISSELSDTTVEKTYLSTYAYPKLRLYCQSLGLQLVMVDLFKNVPVSICCGKEQSPPSEVEDVSSDRLIYGLESTGLLEMAKREINLCQNMSPGPCFVTFLAQRYGHKPLHRCIPEEDFKLLLAAVEENSMKQLISQWYRLDTNAAPAEYVLQSHAGMPMNKWISIHQSLSKTTRKAAKVALGKDVTKAQHYIMSAIEEEVTHGIFNLNKDPNLCCYWFKRAFSDLFEQRPGDHALLAYTDMKTGPKGLEFDSEMHKVLNHLKEARMPAKYVGLDTTNIIDFSLKWQKNKGLDPVQNSSHSEYLSVLSDQFVDALKTKIDDGFHFAQHEASDPIFQEVLHHGAHCKKMGKEFMDRPTITSKVFEYLQGNSATPLVVHGSLGSGKTTFMAGILTMFKSGSLTKKAVLVLRFIGATPQSTNIRHLLLGICKQLSVVYNQDLADIPGDYRSITEHMKTLLSLATAEKPLCIFLDAVDELSPDDGALGMSWLPLALPAYVKIVLSTSSETRFSCFPVLQSLLSDHQETFVEVPLLTSTECKDLLKHSLAARKRCLTHTQEQVVMKSFLQCPGPLYLQFLLREVTAWHSYFWNSGWKPAVDLKGVAEQFFRGVETKFGGVFTRHALGYISATKHGLTEMELLDILSCDDEVMQDLNQSWKSLYTLSESTEEEPSEERLSSIPPLLWSSFYTTLLPFLDYKMGSGGMLVLCWSHRLFEEVANGLYLSSVAIAHARFGKLADYFGGNLNSGSDHPFTQPLKLSAEHNLYNVRKLSNLPHFLTKCGRLYDLKKLLLDYDWLKASIVSFSCPDVVTDFAAVLPLVPLGRQSGSDDSQHELSLIRDALSLSVDALNSNPHDLTAQLLGRLMFHIRDDSSSQCWPILKQIALKAMEDHCPPITPLQPLFHSPGGPLLITMEGHRDLVSCIASTITRSSASEDGLSMTVISSSWDKTLKTWDIKSTGVLKTFDGHTDKVLTVALSEKGQYAVSGSADKTIRHWLVSTAECLCAMKGHKGSVNALALTCDGFKTISASADTTIKVWNTDNSSKTYGQLIFTIKEQKSPVVSLSLSLNDTWLASGAKTGTTLITNIISGEVCQVFKDDDGTVTALATTQQERCNYLVSGTENGTLRVRDIDSMTTLHILQPPGNIERGGVLTVAARLKIIASYQDRCICVWDMITGSHLFELGGHSITSVVHSCTLADNGSLAITGGDDHSIRIWDLQRSTGIETVQQHDGDVTSVVISPCGNFGVSAGRNGVVIIYELIGMKIINTIKGHTEQITQVLAMRDSQHLLTSSLDGTIKFWNGEMGKALKTFFCRKERATCIAITMNADILLTGGDTGTISFWSMKSGDKLKTFTNHSSSVVSVAFVQGSDYFFIVSAAQDGQICVRDFHTAKVLLRTQPNGEKLLCTSISSNIIAKGLENYTCHILSLPDGKLVSVLSGHKQPVTSVKILPNKNQCLTASLDCTIRLFDIPSSECITVFRTDLPITSVDIDQTGEMILYGTKKGWISTAFNQQNKISPLLKQLKDGHSSSMSSLQTSTDSEDSIGSAYENLCTSMDGIDVQASDDGDTEGPDNTPEGDLMPPSQTVITKDMVFSEQSLAVSEDIDSHSKVVDSSLTMNTNNSEPHPLESSTVELDQKEELRGEFLGSQQIPVVEGKVSELTEPQMTIPDPIKSTTCSIL